MVRVEKDYYTVFSHKERQLLCGRSVQESLWTDIKFVTKDDERDICKKCYNKAFPQITQKA